MVDEDYYKPIRTTSAFNSNYIEYESKGDKSKNLSIKEYLNMIRPYLRDITRNHKTEGEWKFHSGNRVINYKSQDEWKIQLSMTISSDLLMIMMILVSCIQRVIIYKL